MTSGRSAAVTAGRSAAVTSGRSAAVTSGRVVVVGGGLAGLAAAVSLADSGAQVVLLEGRRRLGGATFSFRRGDLEVDNGQHVFLGCCTRYRAFLRRLGVESQTTLQPRLDVRVVAPGGRSARLRRGSLPAPLHLASALARYRLLPAYDRARAVRAALALGRLDPDDPEVDRQSFGAWLRARGQSDAAVERLWELVTVATLNAPADAASLALAAKVVRTGLLESRDGGDIGWSDVPLSRLHADPAAAVLRAAGAHVSCGERVRAVRPTGGGVVVDTDSGSVEADAVVVATPAEVAAAVLPPGAGLVPAQAARLGRSPIVGVHLRLDRTVVREPLLAAVGSPVQWVFDRTRSSGLSTGQYLALSVSAADDDLGRPAQEVCARYWSALREIVPAARGASLVDAWVTREAAATFRQAPGTLSDRATTVTGLPGVVLAGAWTRTGWPATMEGAVRSGEAAAASVTGQVSRTTTGGS